jgi:hypothetical protein
VSYGPKSAAEYLEDHGFVPEMQPGDSLWYVMLLDPRHVLGVSPSLFDGPWPHAVRCISRSTRMIHSSMIKRTCCRRRNFRCACEFPMQAHICGSQGLKSKSAAVM